MNNQSYPDASTIPTSTHSVTDVVKAANGRWYYILGNLGVSVPENHRHGACPKCGGKDRFRFDDKNGKGTWFCNHCGSGDGLDLIKLVTGQDIKTVCFEINKILHLPEFKKITPTRIKKA
ncbi:primase-helicase zinc-binding domain-containing protein, partial [Xenorhabdus bovienii]|uniref:primase-helicase zinc-binding domain-containing protein n=1 Tax=Xenorhabdus bovienii TaxID=40576 RepID=UPI003DA32A21